MKLILHHALKDLRAQRRLLAAWAAALLTLAAVDAIRPDLLLAEPGRRRTVDDPVGWVLLSVATLRVLLSWLIAVRIVHADPLDSTEAFWLTRPLSLRTLLAAKAGAIGGLFVGVPAAVVAVVLAANGVSAAAIPGLVLRWLLIDLVLLLPVVLVATLTRDLARVVLFLGVMLAGWAALQLGSASAYVAGTYSELIGYPAAILTAWIGTLVVVAATTAALVALHYLTRQRRNTVLAAIAALLLCAGLAWVWPVRLLLATARESRTARSWIKEWRGGGQVALEVVRDSMRGSSRTAATDGVIADIRVTGLDNDVVFDTLGGGKATLSFPGSGSFVSGEVYWRGINAFNGVAQSEANVRVVERVIGARVIDDPGTATSRSWRGLSLVQLPSADYFRHQGVPGSYEAELRMIARRVSVAATIPFVKGASAQLGDLVTTIVNIGDRTLQPQPGRRFRYFVVELRIAAPRTLSTRTFGRTGCLLLNRRRGEAVPLRDGSSRLTLTDLGGLAALAVWGSTRELSYPVGQDSESPNQPRWLDKSWLADAELVFLSSETLGTFTRRISVRDFTLPELYIRGEGLAGLR